MSRWSPDISATPRGDAGHGRCAAFREALHAKLADQCAATDAGYPDNADLVIDDAGRRNSFAARGGVLPIVCPIGDGSDVCGVGVLTVDPVAAAGIVDGDPGVQAGVLTYELHPCRSFPGTHHPG